jgi:hypothetical protein
MTIYDNRYFENSEEFPFYIMPFQLQNGLEIELHHHEFVNSFGFMRARASIYIKVICRPFKKVTFLLLSRA